MRKWIEVTILAAVYLAFLVVGAVAVDMKGIDLMLPEYNGSGSIGNADLDYGAIYVDVANVDTYIDIPEQAAPASPSANVGRIYVADSGATTTLYFKDAAGVATNLLTAGTGNTLDQAYDQGGAGSGKAITADNGAVAISNTDADAAWLLTLNASPSAGAALGGLQITNGANSSQDALEFVNAGSGNDIYGTGGLWTVTKAGAGTFATVTASGVTNTGTVTQSGGAVSVNANSNFATSINTGTSSGAVAIGGGSGNVSVNSSSWDVSTAGAVSGLTSIALDGTMTVTNGDAIQGSTTDAETWSLKVYDNNTGPGYKDAILFTNGNVPAIAIGDNNPTVAVNSSDWDISTTGAMTGIGAITMDGLLTASLGATVSGAVVSLNADSNFATNINTGTSNAALSLGGGSGTVAVDSTSWDVSTAGAFTGVADITGTAGEAMTITLAANGAADDLTLSVTGAQDSSVLVQSSGTGADAIAISTTAGGIDLTVAGAAANEDLDLLANTSINITGQEADAAAIVLNASNAAGGIDVDFGTGNMVVTGTGASADFVLDCDLFSIDGTGTSNVTVTSNGAGEDFTIALAGATDSSLVLSSTGTEADALQITASAGGIDISATGAATQDIDITNTGGSINLTATENDADAMVLTVNGGTSEKLKLLAAQGTGVDSISITSTAGGILLDAGADDDIEVDSNLDLDENIVGDGGGYITGMIDVVTNDADGRTLTIAECGNTITNSGAGGAFAYVLPEGSTAIGCRFTFVVMAAQALRIDPADATDQIENVTNTNGDYYWADAVGETATVQCVAADSWVLISSVGTWTEE